MIDQNGMKVCSRCKEVKLAREHFHKSKRRPDGHEPYCKACNAKKYQDRKERDPELVREQSRLNMARQRAAKPEKFAELSKQAAAKRRAETAVRRKERYGDIANGERRCARCKEIKPISGFRLDKRKAGGASSYCLECDSILVSARRMRYHERHRDTINQKQRERKATAEFKAWEAGYRQRPHVKHAYKLRDKVRPHKRRTDGDGLSRTTWLALLEAFGHRCCYCRVGGKMTIEHLTPVSRGGLNEIGNLAPACGPCNGKKKAKTAEEWVGPDRAAEIRRRAMICVPVKEAA